MRRTLSVVMVLAMLLSLCTAFSFASATVGAEEEAVQVKEYIGDLTVTKFNGIWAEPTANTLSVITPGNSISGVYYEKLYAKYDETLDCYVVVEKVANHRSYTQAVQPGYIGICFNYAPLTTAGSSIAKANWYVWQHIRVGDRLHIGENVDLELKNLKTEGVWGTSSYKSESFISVETVRDLYPTVTPYSNKSIVAQGDSITVGGGWTSVWSDYFSTTVINSGFGGDTAKASLASRYETYVASYSPEIVFVSFGINDAFSAAPSTELMEEYKNALRGIYAKNTELGATTVFMTANVIKISAIESGVFDKGDYSPFGGEEAYLDTFINCMREVATECGCIVIDLYSMWKEEGLSPDNIIDSCHPNGNGYDRNWVVQKDALIKEMNTICGDDIRVYEGTTAASAINGMPDCTVDVFDTEGNAVSAGTVLHNGYTVKYSYDDNGTILDLGTYTVKVLEPDKLLLSADAPFMVKNGEITREEGLTALKVVDYVYNTTYSVADKDGNAISVADELSVGDVITLKNEVGGQVVATITVVEAKAEEGGDVELPDPYEGWEKGKNLLAGMPYTSDYNAFWGNLTDNDNTRLTDGKYRGDGETAWNGDNGTNGVSVEYAGTTAITSVIFSFDKATDIHVITFKSVRVAANRGFLVDGIGVSTDGVNYTNIPFTVEMIPVEGAPGYGTSGLDQYYDIVVRADVEDALGLRLAFGTDGAYIVQLDEIEAAVFVDPSVSAVLGDVDGDGRVDSSDASFVLRYDLGLVEEDAYDFANADVNGDGSVDSADASLILQLDAGLIEEF